MHKRRANPQRQEDASPLAFGFALVGLFSSEVRSVSPRQGEASDSRVSSAASVPSLESGVERQRTASAAVPPGSAKGPSCFSERLRRRPLSLRRRAERMLSFSWLSSDALRRLVSVLLSPEPSPSRGVSASSADGRRRMRSTAGSKRTFSSRSKFLVAERLVSAEGRTSMTLQGLKPNEAKRSESPSSCFGTAKHLHACTQDAE